MRVVEAALPEAFAARVAALPVMPAAAHRALELARTPTVEFSELGRVISADVSLTADLLRFTNSAWFGFRDSVSSVPHAIALLGLGQLRSVLLASVVKGMKHLTPERAVEHQFAGWNHAIRTAVATRRIATVLEYPWFEDAFAAGLLHDCGRDIMLILETEAYLELLAREDEPCFLSVEAERRGFGFTHADVGGAILRIWKLPAELVSACVHHHDPGACDTRYRRIAAAVSFADFLAEGSSSRPEAAVELASWLGVSGEDALDRLAEAVLSGFAEDVASVTEACAQF